MLPELRRSPEGVVVRRLAPDHWRVVDLTSSRDHRFFVSRLLHDRDVEEWATLREVWPDERKPLARKDSAVVSATKIGIDLGE
jgi:hypothetical protein